MSLHENIYNNHKKLDRARPCGKTLVIVCVCTPTFNMRADVVPLLFLFLAVHSHSIIDMH